MRDSGSEFASAPRRCRAGKGSALWLSRSARFTLRPEELAHQQVDLLPQQLDLALHLRKFFVTALKLCISFLKLPGQLGFAG